MLAYLATKEQFLLDAPDIEDIVKAAVVKGLNLHPSESEFNSWRNSLGNAMFHVMNNQTIPSDALIAVEYRMNGRAIRLDFIVAGKDKSENEVLLVVELKQWTNVDFAEKNDHVNTFLGKGIRSVVHPSYQAWSYKSHLESYNEYIYENKVKVLACAYLHNMPPNKVITDSRYENYLAMAPVFLDKDRKKLQEFILDQIAYGVDREFIEKVDGAKIIPSKELADSVKTMLNGKNEFVLLDDQKSAYEEIIYRQSIATSTQKQVVLIKGGPGTGKSVIAINALATLVGNQVNTKYITANAAPRDVFKAKLIDSFRKVHINNLFSGSGSFHDAAKNSYECLIVDEAHRLRMKSGIFNNLGENQCEEIVNASLCTVFFIDEAQKIHWQDVGEISRIKAIAARAGAEVTMLELKSQFRCSGADDYLAFVDDYLGIKENPDHYFTGESYEFKIVDSAAELRELIREKNLINNRARLVAGYCWNWASKKDPSLNDIVLDDGEFEAQWNLASYGNEWIINPESVEEVGCIHTCQGLEVDYIGVIIGPDMKLENGKFVTYPENRARTDKSLFGYKKELKENPDLAHEKADELIRNTYRTLMTRGLKGCYVYFAK